MVPNQSKLNLNSSLLQILKVPDNLKLQKISNYNRLNVSASFCDIAVILTSSRLLEAFQSGTVLNKQLGHGDDNLLLTNFGS